jgi:hypothetical protein
LYAFKCYRECNIRDCKLYKFKYYGTVNCTNLNTTGNVGMGTNTTLHVNGKMTINTGNTQEPLLVQVLLVVQEIGLFFEWDTEKEFKKKRC